MSVPQLLRLPTVNNVWHSVDVRRTFAASSATVTTNGTFFYENLFLSAPLEGPFEFDEHCFSLLRRTQWRLFVEKFWVKSFFSRSAVSAHSCWLKPNCSSRSCSARLIDLSSKLPFEYHESRASTSRPSGEQRAANWFRTTKSEAWTVFSKH